MPELVYESEMVESYEPTGEKVSLEKVRVCCGGGEFANKILSRMVCKLRSVLAMRGRTRVLSKRDTVKEQKRERSLERSRRLRAQTNGLGQQEEQ